MADDYEKGRMIQESNPTMGREAAFVPQHDSTGDEDYRRTSPKDPLPTTLYGIDSEGNPKPVNVDENGNVLTQLTGSNVELIRDYSATVVNGGVHSAGDIFARGLDIPSVDVSGYKDITILIEALAGSTTGSAVLRMF